MRLPHQEPNYEIEPGPLVHPWGMAAVIASVISGASLGYMYGASSPVADSRLEMSRGATFGALFAVIQVIYYDQRAQWHHYLNRSV